MPITLEKLEEMRDICKRIQEIDARIRHTYDTYHSPCFNSAEARGTNKKSDPVVAAFARLESLDKQKAACLEKWIAFEKELCQIPEVDIQAIIRWRYLIPTKDGSTRKWHVVNKLVYGYQDRYFSRKRLERFLSKQSEGGETNGDKEET